MRNEYLSIGNVCNLKCKFCYNDLNKSKKIFSKDINELFEEVSLIKKGKNSITIIGGEPFIYKQILELLQFIKKLKFKNILIVTNGIKLSDINFAIKLYYFGITSLQFSIHANTIELEQQITERTGNNLYKREVGINNILNLNKKFDNKINLYSNTVINIYNYKSIIEIIKYIGSLGIYNISLSFIYSIEGLSDQNKKLLVKYSDVIQILNTNNNKFNKFKLEIDWLPYCLHKKITGLSYNIREVSDTKKFKKEFREIDNYNKHKIKTRKCENCFVYGKLCNGVFDHYISAFGDSEFISVNN